MRGFFSRRDPLLSGIATLALLGGFSLVADADPLGPYAWENRPLFVYAPSSDSAGLVAQRNVLEPYLQAMRDRDMVWVEVVGDDVTARLGPAPDISAIALRQIHDVPPEGVRSVLVGKDTGVKLVSADPIGPDELFGLIDSMPMRQSEMRRLNQAGWTGGGASNE